MTLALSREKILAMPAGPEMDALVAERVMGVKPRPVRVRGTTDEFVTVWSSNPFYSDGSHDAATLRGAPQPGEYSRDIAAAWRVVEKLTAMPTPYLVGFRNIASSDGIAWEVTIYEPLEAETLPLAICRAALNVTIYGLAI